MNECVILIRYLNNDAIGFIYDDEDPEKIHRFANRDEAIEFALGSDFLQCGQVNYQIVELDEL